MDNQPSKHIKHRILCKCSKKKKEEVSFKELQELVPEELTQGMKKMYIKYGIIISCIYLTFVQIFLVMNVKILLENKLHWVIAFSLAYTVVLLCLIAGYIKDRIKPKPW